MPACRPGLPASPDSGRRPVESLRVCLILFNYFFDAIIIMSTIVIFAVEKPWLMASPPHPMCGNMMTSPEKEEICIRRGQALVNSRAKRENKKPNKRFSSWHCGEETTAVTRRRGYSDGIQLHADKRNAK